MLSSLTVTLSFKLHLDNSYEGRPHLWELTPVPEVNGASVFGDKVPCIDAFQLLTRASAGATEDGFDLCTCTCGVAGCAGFHDPVEVKEDVAAGTVSWHIPVEGVPPLCGQVVWCRPVGVQL